jgi:DNA polymerase-3 subunit gamma/tau
MAVDPASQDNRYVVVARRYRPRGFGQLVGQDHISKALANAIETNRVGHAYLFTGARGTGKTSTARIFAKALNAPEGPTANPDNSSDICQAIDAGEDIDVLEIDGASNRGIDEIRQLRAGVGVRPSRARFKIYIIDEVHMLTTAAFNALLKTLEEPPEHVKFIFCTTDPEKIPITVLSRCQRFDFAPVHVDQIAGRLREIVDAEGAEADDDALRLLARRAAGSMRDSQSLLEQMLSFSGGRLTVQTVHAMLGTADDSRMLELAAALSERNSRAAIELIDAAILGGVDPGQLAEQLLGFFRDMMTAAVGCDAEMLRFCSTSSHEMLVEQGRSIGLQTLLGIVGLLDQTLVRIRQSVHAQVLLEAAVVQICLLPDLQVIADLAQSLSGVPKSLGGQPPVQKPPVQKKKQIIERQPSADGSSPTSLAGSAFVSSVAHSGPPAPKLATSERTISQETKKAGCELPETESIITPVASPTSAREMLSNGLTPPESLPQRSAVDVPKPVELGAPQTSSRESGSAKASTSVSTVVSRRQRVREAEQHPGVRQVMDLFDAEIVRVDEPRE